MAKKNPFDAFKVKEGETTMGELHPSITLTTEEFRKLYDEWIIEYNLYFIGDEKDHLLALIGLYQFVKQQNIFARKLDKKLGDRIQKGKIIDVSKVAISQAEKLLDILKGKDPAIVTTPKGKELAVLLLDLIDNSTDYIADKTLKLSENRKSIDDYLQDLGFRKDAKKALYRII